MNKEILSETAVYSGEIKLPEGVEINSETLRADVLSYTSEPNNFPFSRSVDILNTYIRDFFMLKHRRFLIKKDTVGSIYKPNEQSLPVIEVDPMDLRNSVDYVLLYGVKVDKNSCNVVIEYDDNKFKNKFFETGLNTNHFVMFPAHLVYRITPNLSSQQNYLLTFTYESK